MGATLLLVSACGSSGPPPPWRSGHPDPGSLSLLDSAQAGSCAAKAPDPNQAPAAISFQGQEYVQTGSSVYQASPAGGVEIDHTGDWSFFLVGQTSLTMVTPQADYTYQVESC
jgi:hypothetical protein